MTVACGVKILLAAARLFRSRPTPPIPSQFRHVISLFDTTEEENKEMGKTFGHHFYRKD
jgi:hypothetical protein